MFQDAYTRQLRSLFYAFLALLFVAYAWIAFDAWNNALDDTRQSLRYINSSQVQGLRHTLKSNELNLKSLGRQLVFKLGALKNPEKGRDLFEDIRSIDEDAGGFGLTKPDGQVILISGVKPGTKLPNLLEMEESRESFLKVLQSEHIQMGRVYFVRALDRWSIPMRTPIRDAQGKVVAVMTAGYNLSSKNSGLSSLTLPPYVTTVLLREDGYMQFISPLPSNRSMEDAYLKPIHSFTQQQIKELSSENGFTSMFLTRLNSTFYVSYAHLPEYKLLSAAFTPRIVVIMQWLKDLLAPSILLILSLVGGIWIYRRSLRQQKETQQKIEKLSDWQEALLDSADYSIISTDTNGLILSFNSAAERMLGYQADEMIGKQTPQIIHKKDEIIKRAVELSEELGRLIEPGFEVFVAYAKSKKVDEREWTYICKDGSTFPVRLSVTAVQNAQGEISGFLGVAADLTDFKLSQKNLSESEARYRNLYESATDGILLVDSNGKIIDCNPAALYLFGYDKDELIGSTPIGLSPAHQPDGSLSSESAMKNISNAFNGQATTFDWLHSKKNGSTFHALVTLNNIHINNTQLVMGIVRDITERKNAEEKLEYMVSHDSLTGLTNRYSMNNEINRHTTQSSGTGAALILIDLDRFKEINDTLGHHIGDHILKQIGNLMINNIRYENALISRLGGDEFTVFMPGLNDPDKAFAIASHLREEIKRPFKIDSINLEVDSSAGIAIYPNHGSNSQGLLRSADVAMYTAKAAGGGVSIYNPATDLHSHERLAMLGELGTAIREDQLRLFYQPKIDLRTQSVTGFEALVRWQHPKHGMIYPNAFIPLAEVSDIIHPLTIEVINLALSQQEAWITARFNYSVAINISARNLIDDKCINHLQSMIQRFAIKPEQLELEITESSLMKDPEGATIKLNKIAALGVSISIDDFGTGFSSLAYLKKLPISTLKIDRTFVKDMLTHQKDNQIVQSTINLAHNLNIQVVAEGVEDQPTFIALQQMGCDIAQGYYMCKPLPWTDIEKWMHTSTLWKK